MRTDSLEPVKQFRKIVAASLVSQAGSHFLTIAIASYVFLTSGSAVRATSVFVFTYLPSALFSRALGHAIDRLLSKRLFVAFDAASALLTVVIGVLLERKAPLAALAVALSLRSLCMISTRTAAIRLIREITPPSALGSRLKLYFFTFFCSTAIAGVVAGAVDIQASLGRVIAIDLLTYAASIAIFLSLAKIPALGASATGRALGRGEFVARVWGDPRLRNAFFAVVLSQSFFQGAFSVLVTFLPLKKFALGAPGLGAFQIAASIGITAGFVVLWRSPNLLKGSVLRLASAIALAALGWWIATAAAALPASLLAFFALNLGYELVWLHGSTLYFEAAPRERVGEFQFFLTASASFCMSIVALVYALAIESLGGASGTYALMALGAASLACAAIASRAGARANREADAARGVA